MTDCLFCRMVAGEIPADVVHQTDRVFAFRDINPQAPTHVLVIPKEHHRNLGALAAADPGLLGEVVSGPRTPSPSRRGWSPTAGTSPATASSPTPVRRPGSRSTTSTCTSSAVAGSGWPPG